MSVPAIAKRSSVGARSPLWSGMAANAVPEGVVRIIVVSIGLILPKIPPNCNSLYGIVRRWVRSGCTGVFSLFPAKPPIAGVHSHCAHR